MGTALASAPRLLLVDDDATTLHFLSRLFTGEGFAVEATLGGAAAVGRLRAAAEGAGYDVVLCDLHMPKVGGGDVLRATREQGGAAFVLMTTSIEDDVPRLMPEGEGPDAFIRKTEGFEALVAVVNGVVAKRRAPPPGDEP